MTVAKNRGGRPPSKIPMKMVKIKGFDHQWVLDVALASNRSIHAVFTEVLAIARAVQEVGTIDLPVIYSENSQHKSP